MHWFIGLGCDEHVLKMSPSIAHLYYERHVTAHTQEQQLPKDKIMANPGSKEDRWGCDICRLSYHNSGNCRRHVAAHHHGKERINESGKAHVCEECSKSFITKAHLKEHLMLHSGERPFQCPVCSKGFFRGPLLQKHLVTHASTYPFVNDYEMKRKKQLKAQHACTICGRVYQFRSRLEEHMMRHTGEKPIHCKVCHKGFFHKGQLKRHMKSRHVEYESEEMGLDTLGIMNEAEKPKSTPHRKKKQRVRSHTCVCKECGKVMTNPKSPRKPTAHDTTVETKAPSSEARLSVKASVEEEFGISEESSRSQCTPEAKKKTEELQETTDHTPQHRTPKAVWTKSDLTCKHCDKVYDTRKKWREHQKCHKTEKPIFLCSICGKSFLFNALYKNHLLSHSDERPFSCSYCGQCFKQNFNVKHHIKIRHIASKSFLCHLCGNSYTSNNSLQIHLQIHSGEKPFQCEHCPKAFTLKSNSEALIK